MAKLVITEGSDQRTLELMEAPVLIGREVGCEVVIADPHSSRRHCRIDPSDSGYELVDLGSSNGTLHIGTRVERVPLAPGDRVTIGEVKIEFFSEPVAATEPISELGGSSEVEGDQSSAVPNVQRSSTSAPTITPTADDPHLVVVNGPLEGKRISLTNPFVIGRREDCDLVLPDRKASGRHARLEQQGNRWIVNDLDSGNGLFIGKSRVSKHKLVDGDLIGIGDSRLRVRGLPIDPAMSDSSSASQIFRAVDEGEISEEDLTRLRSRVEETESSLQWLYTGIFVLCMSLIVYYGESMIRSLVSPGELGDPNNKIANGSFEDTPEAGWDALWEVDTSGGDPALLSRLVDEDVPHGHAALRIDSGGEEHDRVRVLARGAKDVLPDTSYLLAGQLRNRGFSRVGLFIERYTRQGSEFVPIEESYTEFRGIGNWSRVSGTFSPPQFGEPQAYRVGILGLGVGTVDVDDLILKPVEGVSADPLSIEVRAGGVDLTAQLDVRGCITLIRDGLRWLRNVRFANSSHEDAVPWGQLLPSRREQPKADSGSIRNSFQIGLSNLQSVAQITQQVGDRIRVAYTPKPSRDASLVLELDRALDRETASLYFADRLVVRSVPYDELDGLVGDELVLGDGADQLIVTLGLPGKINTLTPEAGRGARAIEWVPSPDQPLTVFEAYFGTVSDRERRRVEELWSACESHLSNGEEGKALICLQDLEAEFPWRVDLQEQIRVTREKVQKSAEKRHQVLVAIRGDLDRFPGSPIATYLAAQCEDYRERFAGSSRSDDVAMILQKTRQQISERRQEADQERAREILQVADSYYEQRRDRVAAFYYQWLKREFADSEEAKTATHRLELIEAREGGQS